MKRFTLVCGVIVFLSVPLPAANAVTIDLGDAADFALLAMLRGTDVPSVDISSSSNVTGDIGVGPGTISTPGLYKKSASGDVVGDVFLAPGTTQDLSGSGSPGTIHTNSDLSFAIADALQAASDVAGLSPTQIFVNLTSTQTITGAGGVNVISANKIDLSGGDLLTLSGGASDYFIFQLTDRLEMSGGSEIALSGGALGSHVLYYISGTGAQVDITAGGTLKGTILSPERDIKFHGNLINGAIIGNDIDLGSSGDITYNPFVPPPPPPPPPEEVIPEPSSLFLLGPWLAALGFLSHRKPTR